MSAVADVRSSPYSKYVPQFSKENLQHLLREAGIGYGFLGRELGARREEESCYADDQARYALIAQLPIFRAGLDRILSESEDHAIALMCSEADPLACHRAVLVCRELIKLRPGLRVTHILPDASGEPLKPRWIDWSNYTSRTELFGELSSREGLAERVRLRVERIAARGTGGT